MKKIKFGFIIMFVSLFSLFTFSKQVHAKTSFTAKLKNFNLSESWGEPVDFDKYGDNEIRGDRYHYGYIDGWSQGYKFYHRESDTLYILVLTQVRQTPGVKTGANRKRNASVFTEVVFNDSKLENIATYPSSSQSQVTSGSSFGISSGIDIGSEDTSLAAKLNAVYTNQVTTNKLDIVTQTNIKKSEVTYNIIDYKKNINTGIAVGTLEASTISLYQYNNYKSDNSPKLNFTINVKGTIFRDGLTFLGNGHASDNSKMQLTIS